MTLVACLVPGGRTIVGLLAALTCFHVDLSLRTQAAGGDFTTRILGDGAAHAYRSGALNTVEKGVVAPNGSFVLNGQSWIRGEVKSLAAPPGAK